jgi:hypothetical protein
LDETIAIVVVLGVVSANLIADLLYAAVYPRIRRKWREKAFPCRVFGDPVVSLVATGT